MLYKSDGLANSLYQQRINESVINEGKDWSGFRLEFNYDGDELSDYRTSCFVKASNEKEALKKAEDGIKKAINYGKLNHISNPYRFKVVGTLPSFQEYKKTHPLSNILVVDDKGVSRVNEFYKNGTKDRKVIEAFVNKP